jgi:hypothetical protein
MPAINITDLNNAKQDVDHIAAIATSPALTATDRLGNSKNTIAGALVLINADVAEVEARKVLALAVDIPAAIDTIRAINPRGEWTPATVYAVKDLVKVTTAGPVVVWYLALESHTSSAAFATDSGKWRVYQGGASTTNYSPAVAGIPQTVESVLRKNQYLSHFIPVGVNPAVTTCESYIQAAVDATPVGGTLMLDVAGTVLVDSIRSKSVRIFNGSGKLHSCSVLVNRPIYVKGTETCLLKLKDFSSAWAAMTIDDNVSVLMVTVSGVTIDGVHVDANADNHYEMSGAFKYWETGPTDKRPANGIAVVAVNSAPNLVDIEIKNNVINRTLAGVAFFGDMEAPGNPTFLNRTRTTGVIDGCIAQNNLVTRARGNAIIFGGGVMACKSLRNRAVNCMYYAVRYYSDVIDCESIGDIEFRDCDAIVARYNSTDNGYYRTNDSSVVAFLITRTGFGQGGAWNYINNTHNIRDCSFKGARAKCNRMAVGHTTYFEDTQVDMAAFSSVTTPPGMEVSDCRSDGYLYGIGLYTPTSVLTASRGPVKVKNNIFLNSVSLAMLLDSTPMLQVTGNDCTGTQSFAHATIKNATNSVVEGNSFSNGTAIGGKSGINIQGDATGLIIGRNYFDSNITQPNQVSQNVASTPKLVVGNEIAVTTFTNGWIASAWQAGIAGAENSIKALQNSGLVVLCLRLNGVSSNSNEAVLLPVGMRPRTNTGFVLVDAGGTNTSYFACVLINGVVTIYGYPATGRPTALMGNITYAV